MKVKQNFSNIYNHQLPNCPICGEQLIEENGQYECRNMCEDEVLEINNEK